MQKGMKRKLVLDEQRIWNVTLTDPSKPLENKFVVRSKMPAYFWNDSVPKAFFGIRTATQVKYFTAITKGQKNTYITYNSNWLIKNNAGGEFYRTLPTIWQLLIQHQVIKQHFKSRKLIICLFQKFFMKKKMKILSENLSLQEEQTHNQIFLLKIKIQEGHVISTNQNCRQMYIVFITITQTASSQ